MTVEQAQKLLNLIYDQYDEQAAHLIVLGDGSEFAVVLSRASSQWHCWSFSDWRNYRRDEKRQAKAMRRERARAQVAS